MRVTLPGPRQLSATRDGTDGEAVVVACPPHPQLGGDRTDPRLVAVSDGLPAEIDCLRFDYGPWDGGAGERTDVRTALEWARDRYNQVGLFGYSFGGAMALAALGDVAGKGKRISPPAVAVLAPTTIDIESEILAGVDAANALLVVVGTRDTTATWEPIVDRAHDRGHTVIEVEADHHFVGQRSRVGTEIADYLAATLGW